MDSGMKVGAIDYLVVSGFRRDVAVYMLAKASNGALQDIARAGDGEVKIDDKGCFYRYVLNLHGEKRGKEVLRKYFEIYRKGEEFSCLEDALTAVIDEEVCPDEKVLRGREGKVPSA